VQSFLGIIITAASSSIGLAAIQIANSLGAIPIAITRTSAKRDALMKAGAAYVVATKEQDVTAEVMRMTHDKDARIAFDPVGSPGVKALAAAVSDSGTCFSMRRCPLNRHLTRSWSA
jgi:NADPH:quinone reductase-like Zn-dependent oxidoreductase